MALTSRQRQAQLRRDFAAWRLYIMVHARPPPYLYSWPCGLLSRRACAQMRDTMMRCARCYDSAAAMMIEDVGRYPAPPVAAGMSARRFTPPAPRNIGADGPSLMFAIARRRRDRVASKRRGDGMPHRYRPKLPAFSR